jgi:hypothetical protein
MKKRHVWKIFCCIFSFFFSPFELFFCGTSGRALVHENKGGNPPKQQKKVQNNKKKYKTTKQQATTTITFPWIPSNKKHF